MDSIVESLTQLRQRPLLYVGTGIVVIPSVYYAGKVLKRLYDFWAYCRALQDIPGPKAHFLWGNIKDHPASLCSDNPLSKWRELAETYNDYPFYRMWFGPVHCTVFFTDPEAVRVILKSDEPKSLEVGAPYRLVLPWLGLGLLLASGPLWFRNRRLLTPAFHFDILKPYVEVYNEATDLLLEKWLRTTSSGRPVEVFKDISLLTLDIILTCAFSSQNDVQNESNNEYVMKMKAIADLNMKRLLNPFLYPDFIYFRTKDGKELSQVIRYTHQVADDVIESRRKVLAEGGETRARHLDFLDILLTAKDEDGRGLSDVQIRNEVNTFLFEGHDTTASAIGWLLYALAVNQECQDKVRAEAEEVLGGSTEVKWDDFGNVPYLTMCIKEAMRCYSTVPFIARQLSKDVTVCGKRLPKGTRISIPIYLLHHNAKVWGEDHMEYKPERFTPERLKKMDPFAYVPFSAGPRNCIGQNFAMHEIKVAILKIIQRFQIQLEPGQNVVTKAEMVMRPSNDIKLKLTNIS